MKKIISVLSIAFIAILFLKFSGFEASLPKTQEYPIIPSLSLEVGEHILQSSVSKLGIDLDRWSNKGAQQYSRDLIMNPGFEGKIERHVVIVSQHTSNGFSDEAGLGYPDNFWNEAEFDIRSGHSAGVKGVIKNSINSNQNGLPHYLSENPLPPLEQNDVIVLTKVDRFHSIPEWWVNDPELVQIDPYENRDPSTDHQSVRLTPTKNSIAEIRNYSDTIASRSGKMRLINGPWVLSFWAKSKSPEGRLEIKFNRTHQSVPFLEKTIAITHEWEFYRLEFNGKDEGPDEPLQLSLAAPIAENVIWIDSVSLTPLSNDKQEFRKEMIESLKLLNPSYLREFPPLGNTWENLIASREQRKTWAFQGFAAPAKDIFNYSLTDLLNLCEEVGANPWIIIPPTFSDYECKQLGTYLAEKASSNKFSDVILEFGAYSWNWLYRPLAIPYPKEYDFVADRCFEIISEAVQKKSKVRFFVNGPYTLPENAIKNIIHSRMADGMAINPYFFLSLDKALPDKEILSKLLKDDSSLTRSISEELFTKGKSLAVSELNLHTTQGDAKAYERDRVVAGAASGAALAKKALECLIAGANPILIHNLGQYDTDTWDIDGYVDLWGIVRDFGPPIRFRPTGLAVMMLNHVIGGSLYSVKPNATRSKEAQAVILAPFKTNSGWTAALVSSHSKPLNINLTFPNDNERLPTKAFILDSKAPFATNEEAEEVSIQPLEIQIEGRTIHLTIPAWGLITLELENLPSQH